MVELGFGLQHFDPRIDSLYHHAELLKHSSLGIQSVLKVNLFLQGDVLLNQTTNKISGLASENTGSGLCSSTLQPGALT